MKRILEFKKERTFDQIIEDSFKFFLKHIKPMMKIFWKNNMIVSVGLAISYFMYYYYYFGMFNNLFGMEKRIKVFDYEPKLLIVMLFMLFFSIWFFPVFMGTIFGYIRVYMENQGAVIEEKVQQYVKEKFWGFIGLSLILVFLVILISLLLGLLFFGAVAGIRSGLVVFFFILLIIPVLLYAMVFFSLVYPAYFFDDLSVGNAVSQTFAYIKQKFWFSVGVILVLSLLVSIIGAVTQAPVAIYIMLKAFMLAEKQDMTAVGQSGDLIISFFSVISLLINYILKVILLIASVLLYFKLKEFHTHENAFNKIDSIGKNDEEL